MSEKTEDSDNELFEVLSSYGDLNIEETDHNSTTEEDLSETSADRSFVASESDYVTYSEEELLGSSLPCIHHAMDGHNSSGAVSKKIPISTVASRLVCENGISVIQYLVLWQSWEREIPHEYDVSEDFSSQSNFSVQSGSEQPL
ncbi:hypothetical protein N7481_008474 [Penicillium waksmanii]|uniref:uncharacterized protein n=1 Tax=Penicillium waksmanii TaxID=69791 RepID=UPI002547E0B6|nr:uncharacterized protein N7481_008474 [Penicillium waksmanii]KAJ5974767.1 hypothetical protein N7481_008474 [Penicillium waksmanii]